MNTGTKVTTGVVASTHDIDIELPHVAFCRVSDVDPHESHHRQLGVSADTRLYTEDQVRAAIEVHRKRIAELEAARIAYASEFAPDEDGNPDVGSIHENIRKLKADLQRRGSIVNNASVSSEPVLVISSDGKWQFLAEFNPERNAYVTAKPIQPIEPSRGEPGADTLIELRSKSYGGAFIWLGNHSNCQRVTERMLENALDPTITFLCKTRDAALAVVRKNAEAPQPADHSGAQNGIHATQHDEPVEKPYPIKLYAWGGVTRYHDYEMSDGSIQTLKDTEAKELGWGRKPTEPVKVDAKASVPSDAEIGQILKEVLHNSPYGVHQWELWLEFASALFTRYN